ncbi:DUF4920 domain-containing protein [Flavobacterium sp. MFBS3-15]|uniref:DUF4920 domain-containing protein n=1 Tax=Flavobacterium sp. MFBS3-15 TaxID=2989816 RepID=UPI0022357B2E|nr:DUF4920 domain-containing protein [Flavobacterium sp. MFBS3-15]MCW4467855.1 DUF4920 domain-containing protein [Flavobacterium sp. MFBS3-15]
MRKVIIMAAALTVMIGCQKNKETEVKTEETVIETTKDTVHVDTDTVSEALMEEEKETAASISGKTEPLKKIEIVEPVQAVMVDYASFGSKISADKALTKEQMIAKYKNLKPGDTVSVKFKSRIKDVCQKKGCWMAMELPNGKESFVKFKDYAFFVPLNASNSDAIVSGKAFVSETSVAQLKHYAKDGGQSDAEIAKITEPKIEYKFMADGVLISK